MCTENDGKGQLRTGHRDRTKHIGNYSMKLFKNHEIPHGYRKFTYFNQLAGDEHVFERCRDSNFWMIGAT
jgi:hypothetical protein